MINNAKIRNSRSVSQDKEIYSDLTENETPASIHMSSREKVSSKPYSYKNKSFKGSLDGHSHSYKFRKKNKSKNDRMSGKLREYGMPRQDVIEERYYDYRNDLERNAKDLENYSDEDFYDDMEEVCAIHRKELDMVCLEVDCETPVCSKCILVGDHKNHKYVEKENFFKSLEKDKKAILALQREIENSEQLLRKKNSNQLILEKINEQKEFFKKEIEAHSSKVLRAVEARKREVEREVKIYFEQLGEKLGNYVHETVDATQANKDWKKQLDDALRQLNESECDIESGFHFRKLNENLKFEENSNRLISNIGELQNLIDKKLNECLTSFQLDFKDIDSQFLTISKTDVSFKQDLRERMRIVFNNQVEKKQPPQKEQFGKMQNFMNMVDDYQDNVGRDTDLMNDDFDPNGSNLISDLPEYSMKTQKNPLYGRQVNMQGGNLRGNQNFGFMKSQNPMEGGLNEYGQIRSSMFMNNNDGDAFYSQSSINNAVPPDFMGRENRSRSITKKSKKRKSEQGKDLSKFVTN